MWIAAIPILLLAASFWRRAHYRELIRMVDHTREVQAAIQDLLVSVTDAETGRRGYILTGDANYLAAVESAAVKAPAIVHRLADLTRDNPPQQANVQAIQRLVDEATRRGGNAIVAMRFDTSELGGTWTEICAYGTAVVVRAA